MSVNKFLPSPVDKRIEFVYNCAPFLDQYENSDIGGVTALHHTGGMIELGLSNKYVCPSKKDWRGKFSSIEPLGRSSGVHPTRWRQLNESEARQFHPVNRHLPVYVSRRIVPRPVQSQWVLQSCCLEGGFWMRTRRHHSVRRLPLAFWAPWNPVVPGPMCVVLTRLGS
jgi:hypothetical protein